MTYEQAVDYWYGLVNYEKTPPQPDDLRLERMRALTVALGNPQERIRIIHVAGSKGKGSTSAMLAAILQESGYRTGLFTLRSQLTSLLSETRRAVEATGDAAPTFFEVATAIGLLHFARRGVDIAVIEVGLGGRFDSTNVCTPVVSVITSISLDHTQQLGNRLADIAMEKAGIVKFGRPVVSGVTASEARAVIESTCHERSAPLLQMELDFRYEYEPGQVVAGEEFLRKKPRVRITTTRTTWPVMELGLLGQHQAANAAVAVATVEELRAAGWAIADSAVTAGLSGVCWPGRLEVIGTQPLVVLDCAHNVASVQALIDTLTTSFPPARRLLVFAVSADKDLPGMLSVLAPHFEHAYLTRTHSRRHAPPDQLAAVWEAVGGGPCTVCAAAEDAWRAASAAARPGDLVCITGSVFLAGEMRPLIQEAAVVR
jgi:dihydrofolate synthase/folylpolyglutamate synthase